MEHYQKAKVDFPYIPKQSARSRSRTLSRSRSARHRSPQFEIMDQNFAVAKEPFGTASTRQVCNACGKVCQRLYSNNKCKECSVEISQTTAPAHSNSTFIDRFQMVMDNYSETEVDIEDKPISLINLKEIKASLQNPILVSFDPQFTTTDIKHETSQRVSFQKPTMPSYLSNLTSTSQIFQIQIKPKQLSAHKKPEEALNSLSISKAILNLTIKSQILPLHSSCLSIASNVAEIKINSTLKMNKYMDSDKAQLLEQIALLQSQL